ncbi:uncharacterized protein BKA78DRAFT_325874 [Phyllosticta capitalensis]|uniref:uncharacterized protein n=1 Tax=Phyllosticta capitalensis TaxID=121624 RepID=UPI0031303D0E
MCKQANPLTQIPRDDSNRNDAGPLVRETVDQIQEPAPEIWGGVRQLCPHPPTMCVGAASNYIRPLVAVGSYQQQNGLVLFHALPCPAPPPVPLRRLPRVIISSRFIASGQLRLPPPSCHRSIDPRSCRVSTCRYDIISRPAARSPTRSIITTSNVAWREQQLAGWLHVVSHSAQRVETKRDASRRVETNPKTDERRKLNSQLPLPQLSARPVLVGWDAELVL